MTLRQSIGFYVVGLALLAFLIGGCAHAPEKDQDCEWYKHDVELMLKMHPEQKKFKVYCVGEVLTLSEVIAIPAVEHRDTDVMVSGEWDTARIGKAAKELK